ncbi:MAG: cobaltochelatase subunit CobN [Rhodobacteraceae bacterium]|nr:cobaltochelatase subunit CobN [Paracoccaceae bacterium]
MHLLAAQSGIVADGTEPVDAGQTPARIVFLSAADSELAVLAAANARTDRGLDFLRLGQLSWLKHPFSTDHYIENTALGSQLVVVRALGGLSYWSYCLEQLATRLPDAGVQLAVLPGDDRPDDELFELSSVKREDWERLLGYCLEGGQDNAADFLNYCSYMLQGGTPPPAPSPLLRSGLYWPGSRSSGITEIKRHWIEGQPICAIVFYRALLQAGSTAPVDDLIDALRQRRINPLPLYAVSLKDPVSSATVVKLMAGSTPDFVINLTSFALGSPGQSSFDWKPTILDQPGRPVLQTILASLSEEAWEDSDSGLPARDIAMHLALPEIDGRITARAIAFKSETRRDEATQCPVTNHMSRPDRVEFTADLAANWIALAKRSPSDRRVAVLLANYPNRDGRIANGVGLDTPASAVRVFEAMRAEGYDCGEVPQDSAQLMRLLLAGPTNQLDRSRCAGCRLALADYRTHYAKLPASLRHAMETRWGPPESDPSLLAEEFILPVHRFANLAVVIQPARGYNIDPAETFHSPDLPPPHFYLALYFWLRFSYRADAVIHLGKHGNLEWLPGKATALSASCFPEAALGPMPNIYPFIVNDPGEGTQAKRRSQAVIIDHLTPPLTRAETYGVLRELELLIDEYYEAAGLDPRRINSLRNKILETLTVAKIDADAGIEADDDADSRLRKLDAYLCELKESQIRDGLHVFGEAPSGGRRRDLLAALVRVPRGDGMRENESMLRALATDFGLPEAFDPLDCDMSDTWQAVRPDALRNLSADRWRSAGDTVERLELFAALLISGEQAPPGPASELVSQQLRQLLKPSVDTSGEAEIGGLLSALDGRFVRPGPSGAPSRGRPDVLPTGRNFYSVDSRSLPTRTAWELGWKSASLLIDRHLQDEGEWPRAMTLTAWGTSNMRTGGDDIAQALALMGTRPLWDGVSHRVTGFEVIPPGALGRPRVDVTLRVSGFFRDAFPSQMDLVAAAARAVMSLAEPAELNPAAARFKTDCDRLGPDGAGYRVFGSKPGAYGAGLQALIDERVWRERGDLGEAYIEWGGYAYGGAASGETAHAAFSTRLAATEAIVQNQDNREHDLLDSDDYYQFEGGAAAAVEMLRGKRPKIYHNDHSRPQRPVIRTLEEEIGRVVRSRVVNPKWINGVKRHGYKGAFEMAATVDYMFAFAATAGAVRSHHFDLVYSAFVEDEATRNFIADNNPPALAEIAARLHEAIERGLWQPRSNSARQHLFNLMQAAVA